jgi:hypothetical protein
MARRMPLQKLLCLGILFFVFVRQSSFAQCGQTTQKSAVSTTSQGSPAPKMAKSNSKDRVVVLRLEISERGVVRDVEVLGESGKLRAAAVLAAVKFARAEKYIDRTTWPIITVVVRFPQNGHAAPQVGQGVASGVLACVSGGSVVLVHIPPPSAPPSWLFNTRPVIPLLAAAGTEKQFNYREISITLIGRSDARHEHIDRKVGISGARPRLLF